ncbi:MAG: helix-turn-helix domain-containing protein [Lachnospiraceae bacterium]
MNEKRLKSLSKQLIVDPENYMHSFRTNVDMYVAQKDITIREISAEADISLNTLNSILYGNVKDCKLSTVIALARAFQVSLDELIGCGTISPVFRECLQIVRELPENSVYLIHWFIKHQKKLLEGHPNRKMISVMHPICEKDGNLKPINEFTLLDINDVDSSVRGKIFIGLQLTCDHYMPKYSPYDILLIANDRKPEFWENSIILVDGYIYIAQRKEEEENGEKVGKYYSIRDGKLRLYEDEIDELVGYIAAIHTADHLDGQIYEDVNS